MPVPTALDDPFGSARLALIGLHVGLIVVGLVLAASRGRGDHFLETPGTRRNASAGTPYGPSLGCGVGPFEALWGALEPFEGVVDELLASVPELEPGRLPD